MYSNAEANIYDGVFTGGHFPQYQPFIARNPDFEDVSKPEESGCHFAEELLFAVWNYWKFGLYKNVWIFEKLIAVHNKLVRVVRFVTWFNTSLWNEAITCTSVLVLNFGNSAFTNEVQWIFGTCRSAGFAKVTPQVLFQGTCQGICQGEIKGYLLFGKMSLFHLNLLI